MARGDVSLDRLENVGIFGDLSKKELKSVQRLMTPVTIKAGREITKEGEPGREFLVIVSGTAVVRKKGRKVAELGAGDFLGELAVLTGAPRNATVLADTELDVEVLNRREFMSMLDENPKVMKKILLAALKRLSDADRSPTS